MAKLDVKALGLALGITWGACTFLVGLTAMFWGWGIGFVDAIGTLYIGYDISILGSIIGGLWGFVDAGIGGVVIAWLYNRFVA
jgi:hypothetical protein